MAPKPLNPKIFLLLPWVLALAPSPAFGVPSLWPTPAPAEASPVPAAPGQDSPSPWTPALEAALQRALATGCHDGLEDMQELARAGGASGEIATVVARLCEGIRRKGAGASVSRVDSARVDSARVDSARVGGDSPQVVGRDEEEGGGTAPVAPLDRRGRSRLVPALTLFGIWGGIAFDVLAEVDGDRAVVFYPLVGMAGGLVGSILATRTGEITNGQAWAIITGLEYGTASGMLWSAAREHATEDDIIGTGLVTGVIGGGLGLWVAHYRPPAGSVEMVRSGGIWGTAAALMLALMSPSPAGANDQRLLTSLAVGLDVGIVGGALVASRVPISSSRMLLIDAGALAGLGFGLGGTWLLAGSDGHRQLIGAGGLVGLVIGIGVAVALTGDMDTAEDTQARTFAPALIVRDDRGHIGMGALVLSPVAGPPGSRAPLTGVSAALFGGAF